jgi:hypothetical protein
VQHSDHPATTDAVPVTPVTPKPRMLQRPAPRAPEWLLEIRRYLMMRPVIFGGLCLLLILHFVAPARFDLTTLFILAGLYVLVVGSGGLEAARLSGTGGDQRRQERLAEDALKRAGRLQSHLEPGTATDEIADRILSAGHDPRRAVILAGNEVEDALRAVYRHFSEAERMANISGGVDLPLPFMVQELIWRGLLAPDIYDTAEPVLAMREIALAPRAQIRPQIANDIARAAQAVVLRVQSLGIEIQPRRVPLAWMRNEPQEPGEPPTPVIEQEQPPAEPPAEDAQAGTLRFTRTARVEAPIEEQAQDTESLDGSAKEPVARETLRREIRPRQTGVEPSDQPAP